MLGVDIGPQVAFHGARTADVDRDRDVLQPARKQPVFDEKLDIDGWLEGFGQDPDDELVLAHREALHGWSRTSAVRTVKYTLPVSTQTARDVECVASRFPGRVLRIRSTRYRPLDRVTCELPE